MESPVDDTARWGALVKSKKFKEWTTEIRVSSSLTIGKSLDVYEWEDFMFFLKNGDVSAIERMVVPITNLCTLSELKYQCGTERFSALKILSIIHPDVRVSLVSASLRRAGRLANPREQHLGHRNDNWPDYNDISFGLIEGGGGGSHLTSLFIVLRRSHFISFLQEFDALMKSQCLRNLRHLAITRLPLATLDCSCLFDGIKSGLLPSIISLVLVGIRVGYVQVVDLVEAPAHWFSSLQHLSLSDCNLTSTSVCAMTDAIMKLTKSELALEVLDLSYNVLGDSSIDALVSLVESGRLPHLRELSLVENFLLIPAGLARLMDTIQRGRLPLLEKLGWRRHSGVIAFEVAQAVVQAYFKNEGLTADIDIGWDDVPDPSLVAQFREYKERNARLVDLRNRLEGEEFKVLVPLTSAKVFLCGYPEVGKTTLRKTLRKHVGLSTKFKWETRPHLFKEPRTKGIELSRIHDKNNTELILWDLAGQQEFHVLHGTFLADLGLAGGKATTFVLVFKVPFEENVEAKLMYWLKFVASSSVQHVRRQVMIVLNCFHGKQCLESDSRYWMGLTTKLTAQFSDVLHIHPDPIIIDARVAASVQALKDQLFDQARTLLQDVRVPKACFELLQELKEISEGENKNCLPIFTWQAFVEAWKLKHNTRGDAPKNFKICASYLHEIGEIIFFDQKESTQPGSENKSIVVPDPQWFCKEVVGQLLLPKDMLEGGSSIKVSADGSISRIRFRAFFGHLLPEGTESDDVISMLEQVGLCYRKGLEDIIIPALISEDDYTSIDWEGKGFHGVIGRCLATEDKDRCAIPGTLFRRLQVELAQDPNFGGSGDSDYRAGRSFSSFKLGDLLVLVQFDVDHSDPSDDRIDVLVKSLLRGDSTDVRLAKVDCICRIMEKLDKLCVLCCPGLRYGVKVIQPWNARERTPKMTERRLMSLTEIKSLLIKGRHHLSWTLNGDPVELRSLLSESELVADLGSAQQGYDECKREAVTLGLLTEDSVRTLEETFELENGANLQGGDVGGATTKYDTDAGADVTNRDIFDEVRKQHHFTRQAAHEEGHLTRQYIEKSHQVLLVEIRNKHHDLVRLIQAQQEYSIEERAKSVPRYAFLSRLEGKSKVLKGAFSERFELHLLCECHFDDGLLHEVEGQEGVQLTKPKEWWVKVSPWLRRSLQVAVMVGKAVGNLYLPGVFNFIPDVNYLQNESEGSSKAVDTAATMMLEEDVGVKQVGGSPRDYGSAGAPVDLRERMIAEGVIKDLIGEIGQASFKKQIGLRKVLLTGTAQAHTGSSTRAQSSGGESSVRWICERCYNSYGGRARVVE